MTTPSEGEAVTFDADGVTLAGRLYRPEQREPHATACVVMGHGFTGTMDRLVDHAARFVEAGAVVLLFDYRNFGLSGGTPRQVIDIAEQQEDWRAAVRYARGIDGVDPDRIVLWGSSLGGGHAVTIATEDERVAAVIAQVPWLGDHRSLTQKLRQLFSRSGAKLVVSALRDARRARRGEAPLLVPVTGEAGSGAMFTDPGARQALEAKGVTNTTWRNEFAPRIALALPQYSPGETIEQLRAPLLVCVTEADNETPLEHAERVVSRAQDGTVRGYPGQHFDVYHGPTHERVVADQIEFLRSKVDLSGPAI